MMLCSLDIYPPLGVLLSFLHSIKKRSPIVLRTPYPINILFVTQQSIWFVEVFIPAALNIGHKLNNSFTKSSKESPIFFVVPFLLFIELYIFFKCKYSSSVGLNKYSLILPARKMLSIESSWTTALADLSHSYCCPSIKTPLSTIAYIISISAGVISISSSHP